MTCGCTTLLELEGSGDAEAVAVLGDDARAAQRAWRCPAAGFDPPADAADLPDDCRATLAGVAALTGAAGCATCPLAPLNGAPGWDWVSRATEAYAADERGALESYEPDPSNVLLEAVVAVRRGVHARAAHERRNPPPAPAAPAPPPDDPFACE